MVMMQNIGASLSADKGIKRRDRWIPLYFVLFFGVIACVDGILVTIAISTSPGVVIEDAYRKGLAFNRYLDQADSQVRLVGLETPIFKDGALEWSFDAVKMSDIAVHAYLYRPAAKKYDFQIVLLKNGNGIYEGRPHFPVPGLWVARLEAEWLNSKGKKQTYKTVLDLVVQ